MNRNRRRRHNTQGQGFIENVAAEFLVVFVGIDPHAIADPDLVGVADQQPALAQGRCLACEFIGQPLVVRVEQGDPLALRRRDPAIARGGDSAVFCQDHYFDCAAKFLAHLLGRTIVGGVVNHDHLKIRPLLCQYRTDRPAD